MFRLKGYYRYHFQLQSPSPAAGCTRCCARCWPSPSPPAGVEFQVDVDPFNML